MDENGKLILRIAKYTVSGLLGLIVFMGSWFVVEPGQVAVTFSRVAGTTATCQQGLHLKTPFLTGVEKFDVKTQRVDIKSESASKDLQKVDVDVVLNYHLAYDKVNELYVKVGPDYAEKIIDPAVHEAAKAASAQLPVEEIIVKREALRTNIEEMLRGRLAQYNIALESVNLVNIGFDPAFNAVVEQKQMEEQKIKTAQYQRLQAEEKKKQTILEAEAAAESQRLMKVSVTKDIIALKWIEKWDGKLPVTSLGDKSVIMVQPKGGDQ